MFDSNKVFSSLPVASKVALVLSLFFAIGFSACEEVGPPIDFTVVDTSLRDTAYLGTGIPSPDQRVVLIEEHTGVRCPNCPAGHVITEAILTADPDQVALVALHNYFSDVAAGPLSGSTDTLYNDDAIEIASAQGSPSFWPAGTINRKLWPGQSSVIIGSSLWSSLTADEMLVAPKVNITLTPTYSAADTTITVLVKLDFTEDITDLLSISLMVTESEIIQPQDVSGTIDDTYNHEHVLRAMMTPPLGTAISNTTEAGWVHEREFEIHVPEKWDINHLEILGFVSKSGSDLDVLQAAKAPVL